MFCDINYIIIIIVIILSNVSYKFKIKNNLYCLSAFYYSNVLDFIFLLYNVDYIIIISFCFNFNYGFFSIVSKLFK